MKLECILILCTHKRQVHTAKTERNRRNIWADLFIWYGVRWWMDYGKQKLHLWEDIAWMDIYDYLEVGGRSVSTKGKRKEIGNCKF